MASKICNTCQTLFKIWHDDGQGDLFIGGGIYNAAALKHSVANACHLCTLMLGELELLGHNIATLQQFEITVRLWANRIGLSEESNTLVLQLNELSGNRSGVTNPLLIRKLGPSEYDNIVTISDTADTDRHRSLSRKWVEGCLTSHPACCSQLGSNLPTRLIDINMTNPHLCLSKDLPEETRYATLSHCWGKLATVMLTTQNIASFSKQIPYESLCKTFQDVIATVKRFGLKYVWIDSLCIIQDDDDDWSRESSLMVQVYGGSTLNIAATAGSDGNAGLFPPRNPPSIQKCYIEVFDDPVDQGNGALYEVSRTGIYVREVAGSPLGQRAWCLQETFLAPRTLHFGKELVWECRESILSETCPTDMTQVQCGVASVALKKMDIFASEGLNTDILPQFWDAIVESYTASSLTKPADKLVALSGIARWTHETLGGSYACGLWEEFLEHQLLWCVSQPVARPAVYRAPSWSWAAVDGPCSFERSLWPMPSTIRVINVKVLSDRSDHYGQVNGGVLRLSCTDLVRWPFSEEVDESVLDGATFWPDGDPESLSYAELGKSCFCLNFYDLELVHPNMLGIVLQATSNKGEFCRVGIFQARGSSAIAEFEDARAITSCSADETMYEQLIGFDKKGRRQYTISIV